ncbi:sigma-70 family RNA polymerase sigma factor [Bacillus sp. SJS]|uniref:sigma-70 family RNA polymerase sigma factor n=1 Tax=Bacillus sp. SJS TaxID=1423321 RepID=UPI0004DD8E56|nr:sigma-70 family RNA polymerase sigma factor [Bacillus sp. SJS]KZZ84490.1 RNA polymerase factor sigma C [Bacillus sp. SJS]
MEESIAEIWETEDKEAVLDEIIHLYGQDILQLAYSYVKNKAIAEDLTQDIFVKCYKSLHTYNKKSKIRTWLWRIAINTCKDHVKSWYSKNVMAASEELTHSWDSEQLVEEEVLQKDTDDLLAAAVMELPIQYREVIYLFYFEELTIKEISTLASVNENTVKTRMKRAKELLKERLEDNNQWTSD